MFTVYVLKSKTSGKIYIGHTSDVQKRLSYHNNPSPRKRSYTRLQGKEWEVVYKEEYETREKERTREKELKSYRGRCFIRSMIR